MHSGQLQTSASSVSTDTLASNLEAYIQHIRKAELPAPKAYKSDSSQAAPSNGCFAAGFPLIDGVSLDTVVEASGVVSKDLLYEAYRYHCSGRVVPGSSRFRPRSGGISRGPITGAATTLSSRSLTPQIQTPSLAAHAAGTSTTPHPENVLASTPNGQSWSWQAPPPPTVVEAPSQCVADQSTSLAMTTTPTAAPPARQALQQDATAVRQPASPQALANTSLTAQWLRMCDFIPATELIVSVHELLGQGKNAVPFAAITAGRMGPILRQHVSVSIGTARG